MLDMDFSVGPLRDNRGRYLTCGNLNGRRLKSLSALFSAEDLLIRAEYSIFAAALKRWDEVWEKRRPNEVWSEAEQQFAKMAFVHEFLKKHAEKALCNAEQMMIEWMMEHDTAPV